MTILFPKRPRIQLDLVAYQDLCQEVLNRGLPRSAASWLRFRFSG